MNVFAKDFETGLSVFFEEGGACEADEGGVGHEGFHGAVEFAVLGAVAFINKDKDVADRLAGLGFEICDELFKVFVFKVALTKFMDEGAKESGGGFAELSHEVAAAAGAIDGFACIGEYVVDLLVKFGPIGDDGDAGVGMIGEGPFGQEDHGDAFAAALGMPDDATLTIMDVGLGGFDAEVLVDAGEFLFACVEEDEVVDEVEESGFVAEFEEVFVEFVASVVGFVFFPGKEVFIFGADRAVTESFGVVSGQDELNGAEEALNEFGLLVGEALTDAVTDRDAAVFQFDYGDGDAVDVENDVGAFLFFALDGDFFGDSEVVGFWGFPVD